MSNNFIILDNNDQIKSKKGDVLSLEKLNSWFISKQKIKIKDKVIFFRLLATMVNAGIPVLKAIGILEKQEKNPVMKNFYLSVISGIKSGKNLSANLTDYGGNFNDSECSMIESGEKTGKLNSSLIQLADQIEKVYNINKKFKGALIYPTAIISILFACICVLMIFVVPKIVEIFGDKSKLPPLTQFLLGVSDIFVNFWWLMILSIGGLISFLKLWYTTPKGKYTLDGILLKMPIFGGINQKVILSKFARVFSNLLSSGISILESLRIVSDAVGNEIYRQRILLLREDVKKGVKIGESLEDDPLFPDILVQMIKIGEETAKLDTIILKIADFYDEDVDGAINNIQKLLEPFIIVTMAVVIGFIAVGIMQPIMSLADVVSNS